jgi:CubicO group peptidase (beta-lactamase class C family)
MQTNPACQRAEKNKTKTNEKYDEIHWRNAGQPGRILRPSGDHLIFTRCNTTLHALMKLPSFTVIERTQRSIFLLCISLLFILSQPGAGAEVGGSPRTSDANEARIFADLQERKRAGKSESVLVASQTDRRVWFKNVDRLGTTRSIKAGASPSRLESQSADFSGLTYQVDGKTYTLSEFLAMPSHIGLIVVQDGKVRFEHYAEGNDPTTPWVSFSVAKSVTSMLIGAAIKDGYIQSVDEPVANYLPRLRGTPYEHATIKHVLQMASGVAWNEDYSDLASDVAKAAGLNGVTLVKYLAQLSKAAEPGTTFNYNTGETNLAGEILRAAIGNNASTYLSRKIWKPFGMESDASWSLDSPDGVELGGCCINATLRDYARIGMFAMSGGVLPDGTEVLPPGWMKESTAPSGPQTPGGGYGYLWWLRDDGAYFANGLYGQQIFIDPARRVVIAAHSNAPTTAIFGEYLKHLNAVIQALRREAK